MVSPLRMLAVTFAYPPMSYPRSIQVPRLLSGLDVEVVVFCGSDTGAREDGTIHSSSGFAPTHVIREPFSRNRFESFMDSIDERLPMPLWAKNPDVYRNWSNLAFRRFLAWQAETGYEPDLVTTFGMPMSDHLFGLACKRNLGLPWIAHFSDPWIDGGGIATADRLSRWINRRMERDVVECADAVIFTSPETVDLVMGKYPLSWRDKAFYLPHICDRGLYDDGLVPPVDRYVVRFLGNLYDGRRSPKGLIIALEELAQAQPELFEDVSFEFIGNRPQRIEEILAPSKLIRQRIQFKGNVTYAESIRLMQTAHCLLVIDAPAKISVFFPSKLVDYIGAGRFLTAVSPPGATRRVVEEVGGYVADPSDHDSLRTVWQRILRERPWRLPRPTGRFDKPEVCAEMLGVIHGVLQQRDLHHVAAIEAPLDSL